MLVDSESTECTTLQKLIVVSGGTEWRLFQVNCEVKSEVSEVSEWVSEVSEVSEWSDAFFGL